MTTFSIEYRDPETGELRQTEAEFSDTVDVTAKIWAEDYAYTLADKGSYTVKEKVQSK